MRSSRRAVVSLVAGALFAVTLAGCGSDSAEPRAAAAETGTTSATAGAEATGPLEFTHTAVGGGEIDFAALAGKPVGLWFWAPG